MPDQRGQSAGVDAGKPDHASAFEPVIEMARGAVVRRAGNGRVQHDAAGAGRCGQIDRLDVLVIGADIADMGKGEGDDLAGIGGIGQDLLIPGHRGIEADLAHRMAGRAETLAFEHGAVGEDEQRSRLMLLPAAMLPLDRGRAAKSGFTLCLDLCLGLRLGLRTMGSGLRLAAHVATVRVRTLGLLVAYYMSRRNRGSLLAPILPAWGKAAVPRPFSKLAGVSHCAGPGTRARNPCRLKR